MSALYATLESDKTRKTNPTCRGSRYIQATVQSYEGSLSATITIDDEGDHQIELACDEGSTADPRHFIWRGSLPKLIERIKAGRHLKD